MEHWGGGQLVFPVSPGVQAQYKPMAPELTSQLQLPAGFVMFTVSYLIL